MKKKDNATLVILSLLFSIWFLGILLANIPTTYAAINQTVLSKVNVSNTDPRVYNVTITPNQIALNAGENTNVICNATVWDYNGVPGNIANVTATFYFNSSGPNGNLANDTRYRVNCTNATSLSSVASLYTCNLSIRYFADNGTWACNVTAFDNGGLNGTGVNNSATILPLIALNVSDVIDYGIVNSLNTSLDAESNVTNFGNTPLNISVRGWGGDNETLYANLSMVCEFGNISIDMERYNITNGSAWAGMTNLTGTDSVIPGFVVNPRNDTNPMINKTYWKLKIPTGVGGLCNGTILFVASNAN